MLTTQLVKDVKIVSSCKWSDPDEYNVYTTECDNSFQLSNDESLTENNFKYCMYCGGQITTNITNFEKSRPYRLQCWEQINKTKARLLFNADIPIRVIPCKLNHASYHDLTSPMVKENSGDTFDSLVKAYIASDCKNGNGAYPKYYVDIKVKSE